MNVIVFVIYFKIKSFLLPDSLLISLLCVHIDCTLQNGGGKKISDGNETKLNTSVKLGVSLPGLHLWDKTSQSAAWSSTIATWILALFNIKQSKSVSRGGNIFTKIK